MGISRDKWHKRRATGGKRAPIRMKRKFELGRQPANTKLGERRVHQVRCRGGYIKFRALRVDHGNYAWPGEAVTRKTRIISVVYNPTNPEYVRTNTIVKGSVVQIDATPFKNWYQKHYGVVVGKGVSQARKFVKKKAEKKTRTHKPAKIEKPKKAKVVVVEKKTKKGSEKKGSEKKGSEKKGSEKKGSEKKGTTGKAVETKSAKKATKPTNEAKPVAVAKPKVKKVVAKPTEVATPVVKKVVKQKVPKGPKKVAGEKKERKCKTLNNSRGKTHRPSGAMLKKWRLRNSTRVLETAISEQFEQGRLFAKVSTSPGQIGSADGYVLEGEELAFYVKKMQAKKKK